MLYCISVYMKVVSCILSEKKHAMLAFIYVCTYVII